MGYHGLVGRGKGSPSLPHPRLHERAFVLLPLRDVAPRWRHPVDGRTVAAMIAALPAVASRMRYGVFIVGAGVVTVATF